MKKISTPMIGNEGEHEEPFSDYDGVRWTGWVDKATGQIPLEPEIEAVKTQAAKDSQKLRMLVMKYRGQLAPNSDDPIQDFWKLARESLEGGLLSREEWSILCYAEAGDIRSAQILAKANPEVIHLPFIADILIDVLRQHKYTPLSSPGSLEDIKIKWEGFLSPRTGGRHPYDPVSLRRLIERAKQSGVPSSEVYDEIAEKLPGITSETLRKSTAETGKRGRPRKDKPGKEIG